MNFGVLSKVIGNVLTIFAALMLPSTLISHFNGGADFNALLFTNILSLLLGLTLKRMNFKKYNVITKDALLIVVVAWIVVSLFGAIPFVLSGAIPSVIDAVFEVVSGFTTTGSTILSEIESMSKGLLFWRSTTHWIGGMGILVFTLTLLPSLGIGGFEIFKAESPGPVASKIMPKMVDTAKTLYKIYIGITIVLFILLLFGGMDAYDSAIHTFGVVGTGGFSNKNASIGHYNSAYIDIVIGIFMLICGTNFGIYYNILHKKTSCLRQDDEFKTYMKIVGAAVVLISVNLFFTTYEGSLRAVRDAFFQVSSVVSTSGFSTVDYDLWPSFSKFILFMLMITGASAGSTAGGIKMVRVSVIFKLIKREVVKVVHKRAVVPVKLNGKNVEDDTINGIVAYLCVYVIVMLFGTAIFTLDNDMNILSALSTSITALSNVGPGLGIVGPASNFGMLSKLSKVTMTILMLLGRLEFFTIIALFAPRNWERRDAV